jgi:uncharacterized repeat protein (TIGR01451 family)
MKKNFIYVIFIITSLFYSNLANSDDYPDSLERPIQVMNIFDESIFYEGQFQLMTKYGVVGNGSNEAIIEDVKGDTYNYWQRRHKIEGVLDNPDDIDIMLISFPHDYYISMSAFSSEYKDIRIDMFPANSMYSPLVNGNGVNRNKGDYLNKEENFKGYVEQKYGNDLLLRARAGHSSYSDNVNDQGNIFGYTKSRYESDSYYLVVRYENPEDVTSGSPVKYVINHGFTNIPFESPVLEVDGYPNLVKFPEYLHVVKLHEEILKKNPELRDNVYPFYSHNYFREDVVFNGDFNNPDSMVLGENKLTRKCGDNCFKSFCISAKDKNDNRVRAYLISLFKDRRQAENVLGYCSDFINKAKDNRKEIISKSKEMIYRDQLSGNSIGKRLESILNSKITAISNFYEEDFKTITETNDDIPNKEDYGYIKIKLKTYFGDRDHTKNENYSLVLKNQRTGEEEEILLKESSCENGNNSEEIIAVNSSSCFVNKIVKERRTDFVGGDGKISVMPGDEIEFYTEEYYNNPALPGFEKSYSINDSLVINGEVNEKAELLLNERNFDFSDPVFIEIVDGNENINTLNKDLIDVEAILINLLTGEEVDKEYIKLTETESDSGVFGVEIDKNLVDNESDIVKEDGVIQLSSDQTNYKLLLTYVDKDYSLFDLGLRNKTTKELSLMAYSEEGRQYELLKDEIELVNNKDAVIEYRTSSDFALNNNSYKVSVKDCNLFMGKDEVFIDIKNKTNGVVTKLPVTKEDYNQSVCQALVEFGIYEKEFENVPFDEPVAFAENGDVFELSFEDIKGDDNSVVVVKTGEKKVSGYYGGTASVYLKHQNFERFIYFNNQQKELFLVDGKLPLEILISDSDRDKFKDYLTTSFLIKNTTKGIKKEFDLNYNEDFFRKEITISNTPDETDFYAESGDEVVLEYVDKRTSNDTEENEKIISILNIKESQRATIEKDENVFYFNNQNMISINNDNDDFSRDFIDYSARDQYRIAKITNERINHSIEVFLSREGDGYFVLKKDVGQDVELLSYDVMIAKPDDEIKVEYKDILSDVSYDEIITRIFQVEDSPEGVVDLYTNDIIIDESVEVFVEDKTSNVNPDEKDVVEVVASWIGDWSQSGVEESEILTLEETDVNSGLFKVLEPTETTGAPEKNNGVLELNIRAQERPSSYYYINFKYVSDNANKTVDTRSRVIPNVENLDIYSNKDTYKLGEEIVVNVSNPNSNDFEAFIDVIVTAPDGTQWFFEKTLLEDPDVDGMYKGEFELFDPSDDYPNQNFEDLPQCSNRASAESAVRNIPPSFMLGDFICSVEDATIEFSYNFIKSVNKTVTVNGSIPDPVMEVKRNLEVNDNAWVEVVDFNGNKDSEIAETVYGYAVLWDHDGKITEVENLEENSISIDYEEFELIETGPDTGIFRAEVPLNYRANRLESPVEESSSFEVRSTLYDNEYLMFVYEGVDRSSDFPDGPGPLPVPVFQVGEASQLMSSQGVIEEDLDDNIEKFKDYQGEIFEFREINGGANGLIFVEDLVVDNYGTQIIYVTDLDLNQKGIEKITVEAKNERTEQTVSVELSLNDVDNRYVGTLPIDSIEYPILNNTEDYLLALPNDKVTVSYLDEKREENQQELLLADFSVSSGDTAILDAKRDIYVNDSIFISLKDYDLDSSENPVVEILNERTSEVESVSLSYDQEEGLFRNYLNVEFGDEIEESGLMGVNKEDRLLFTYIDEENKTSEAQEVKIERIVNSGFDGFVGINEVIDLNTMNEFFAYVVDEDLNKNSTAIEEVTVLLKNKTTNESQNITLRESGYNSAEFVSVVSIEDVFNLKKDDELQIIYNDNETIAGSSEQRLDESLVVDIENGATANLTVSPNVEINESVIISVADQDNNENDAEAETILVDIENQRTNEELSVLLTETSENSGVFEGFVKTSYGFDSIEDNDLLEVVKDDVLETRYRDENTSENETVLLTKETIVVSGNDALLKVENNLLVGDDVSIEVVDPDENTSVEEINEVTVVATNKRTEQELVLNLTEIGVDESVFTIKMPTYYSETPLSNEDGMAVKSSDVVVFEYLDKDTENGSENKLLEERIFEGGSSGVLDVEEDLKVGENISVSVVDKDLNSNDEMVDIAIVEVKNERTEQKEEVVLTETGPDTSEFLVDVDTYYGESVNEEKNGFAVVANDILIFTYIDEKDANAQEKILIEERTLLGGVDGELIVENEVFVGESVNVIVKDADENKDKQSIEEVIVKVINPRSLEEEELVLLETNIDSGEFVGSFDTVYDINPVSDKNRLGVVSDDMLTVVYEDKFNSDGGITILEEYVSIIGGFDGEISVTSPNEIGNAMIVTVRDRDLDVSSGADTVVVVVMNERTKESVEVLLTEQIKQSRERTKTVATNSSNTFVGMVYGVNDMVGFGKGTELETFSGDYLVASYVDELNSQGQSETLTAKGLFLGADAIVLDKNALEDSAVVGGLVPYTVEVENVSPNDLTNVEIIDNLPAGFRLAKDFVYIGDDKEPVSANGGVMTVTLDAIESNETIVLTYVLKVGSGVVEGAYENKVKPYIGNILVGNEARATVYIQDDPLFNDALVFGKVFNDVNGNGYLDNGEEGIPGVTIAGVDGINVVTDSKGRYSIEGVDGGRMDRGVNYILKVMPETLPEGSEFTTENPRVQRITQGMPSKFNFGVAVPKQGAYTAMVEVRLGEVFFDWDKDNVKEEYESSLNRIANFIEEQGGGIIIIEGNTDSLGTDEYNEDLALRRASAVYKVLKDYLSDEVYQNIEVKIIK